MNDSSSQYRFFNCRMLAAFTFCLAGVGLALLSVSAKPPSEVARKDAKSSRDNLAAEQVRRGIYRGLPVTYVVKNGKAIFQGDIILDKVDPIDPQQPQSSFGIKSLGITYSQYLWPKVGNQYQIPYIITSGSGNLTNLNTAIAQFNSTFANIKFVARTTQTDYVNFYFDPNNNNGSVRSDPRPSRRRTTSRRRRWIVQPLHRRYHSARNGTHRWSLARASPSRS